MDSIDRRINEYSQRLSVLFIRHKCGETKTEAVYNLSRKLDRLILKKVTFTEKD